MSANHDPNASHKNRWSPSPFLRGSAALHVGALAGTAVIPTLWPLAVSALIANHALIAAAGLLPRSNLLGPNLTRLSASAQARREMALTIDDGPDPEVTPEVLDQLDALQAKATFFCIGWRARRYPALCRDIVSRGHCIENHSDAHSHAFSLFGPARIRSDIAAAQATLSDITGQAPRFFRPTAGLRNPFLDPVLNELDLLLAAWTRRGYDTRDGQVKRVLQKLTRNLSAGDILLIHDGHAARTPDDQPVIVAMLPALLRILHSQNLHPVTLQQSQL